MKLKMKFCEYIGIDLNVLYNMLYTDIGLYRYNDIESEIVQHSMEQTVCNQTNRNQCNQL